MNLSKFRTALLSCVLAFCAANAQATVIGFEGIATSKKTVIYQNYSTFKIDDYSFYTNPNTSTTVIHREYYARDPAVASNGTDVVKLTGSRQLLEMTNNSNTPFNVTSIDLADYYDFSTRRNEVTLTGTLVGGGTVTWTGVLNNINAAGPNDFSTIQLTNFRNLTSFAIGGTQQLGIDNINVSAVPEPSTWVMLGLGLALIGVTTRRTKSA